MRLSCTPALLALLYLSVPALAAPAKTADLDPARWAPSEIGSVDPAVLGLAMTAAECAVESGHASAPTTLTVIDYSRPSTEKRMWVFDLRTHALVFEELVAHGSGSGEKFSTMFSNTADSHESSIGLFATGEPYVGKNGYSLRLDGLDVGFNDRARERAIVIHGAPYVSPVVALSQGRLGRSWGCPAVSEDIAHSLIDRVRGQGLVFAYYPDPTWLKTSKYLNGCSH